MTFQILNYKKNHFFNLLDDDYLLIKPSYMKGSVWFKLIGHSDSLYVKVTKAITNYAFIGKYGFFPKKTLNVYTEHILSNLGIIFFISIENIIIIEALYGIFTAFLEFNPEVFFLHEEIT